MRQWKATVNIKDLLSEDGSPKAVVAVCDGIQKRMPRVKGCPKAAELFDLDTLDDILWEFGRIAEESPDVGELNSQLDELYDWADSNRVWLGLK